MKLNVSRKFFINLKVSIIFKIKTAGKSHNQRAKDVASDFSILAQNFSKKLPINNLPSK